MKASALIELLQMEIIKHGDLPVVVYDGADPCDLCAVKDIYRQHRPKGEVFEIYGEEIA